MKYLVVLFCAAAFAGAQTISNQEVDRRVKAAVAKGQIGSLLVTKPADIDRLQHIAVGLFENPYVKKSCAPAVWQCIATGS